MKNLNITSLSTQELKNYNGGALSTGTTISYVIEIVAFGDPINRFDDLIQEEEETTSGFETVDTPGFGI